ncbi:MAG TPA: xanthine dehydrogenase family protein subunit M [Candidatus Tectomicrobia bacterium]|nr:xanthine dehydrogenase family protein subunit M [Candidatus Tectomicrobia bacterium]
MNRFEYLEAATVPEALSLLDQYAGTRVVAGATDVLIRWRQGLWKPPYILNIKRIAGLDEVRYSPETGLSLGPLVRVRTLELHPLIREHYPALTQAATAFAGVQIRNLATVGGNVCNASPAGDTLPALVAYGAECRLIGPHGERLMALDSFLLGPGRTALQPGELLVELRLPPQPPTTGALYIKHSARSAMDIATVGVAAVVALEEKDGVCREVRIALGAVAPTVVRASAAEALLRGQRLDVELLQQAARAAMQAARPIDDIRGTVRHRQAIVASLTKRTLHYAVQMAQGASIPLYEQRGLAVEAMF